MIGEGELAPDFELQSDSGETVRLSDLRGSWVALYFYPKDDTSGCTTQACGFRDALSEPAGHDVVVLGVSPDDVASHVRFKEKFGLNFPLLADPDHKVADRYGTWGKKKLYGKEYEGIFRTTFLIDPEGRVAKVFERVRPEGHAEEVLAARRSGG